MSLYFSSSGSDYPVTLERFGGDDWSRTSSARGGGFTVHWGYQFSYISKFGGLKEDRTPIDGVTSRYTNHYTMRPNFGSGYGNRTRLTDVKGQCPKPIDEPTNC